MKSTRLLLSMAALSAGLIISSGTRAEDWKPVGQFGVLGIGKVLELEKGHFYWVGEYGGTFFSDKEKGLFDHAGGKCAAWADVDTNSKKVKEAGVCVISDVDGARAYSTFQGAGTPTRRDGTFEWTSGTGKYKEIKGSNTYGGNIMVNWPDGAPSAYATWNR